MRRFRIQYPDENNQNVVEVLTEDDILKSYLPHWYERMCKKYGEEYVNDNYSWKDCLEDWIVEHWAEEIND